MSSRGLTRRQSGAPDRVRMVPAEREAEMLAAARDVLREAGYEKFQPAEVGRRCGVSEALVYRYFPTRSDLLNRVAEEWLSEVLEHEPDVSRRAGTEEALRAVIDHGFQVIRAEPALTRYILLELRADPAFRGTAVHLLNRRVVEHCTRAVEAGVAAGVYRDDIPVTWLRDMIFGAIEHQTWAYLRGEGEFPPRKVAAGIATVIHHGMLVRTA